MDETNRSNGVQGRPPAPQTAEAKSGSTVVNNTGANQPVQFHSSEIGKTTVRPQDPFAEQNKVRAAKKQQQKKTWKKVLIIGGAVLILIIIGIVLWLTLGGGLSSNEEPDDLKLWSSGKAEKLHEEAQKIYNQANGVSTDNGSNSSNGGDQDAGTSNEDWDGTFTEDTEGAGSNPEANLNEVENFFEDQAKAANDELERLSVLLLQMQFYSDNGFPTEVVRIGATINSDRLTQNQFGIYQGLMINSYIDLDDEAMMNEYINLKPSVPYPEDTEMEGEL